jgi:hypothetical protein
VNTNNADAIDAALSRVKQSAIADELNWPESKVSEVKTKLKQDGAIFLAALGLKIVPADLECYDPRKVDVIVEALKVAAQSLTSHQLKSEN